jgi:molybdopterin converting factor subunit 1
LLSLAGKCYNILESEGKKFSIQRKSGDIPRGESMQIRMRYFASLRECTGLREEVLSIAEGTTVAEIRRLLLQRYPGLENALARAVCAINHRYVAPETTPGEGDEVAFIPPVGGGTDHTF